MRFRSIKLAKKRIALSVPANRLYPSRFLLGGIKPSQRHSLVLSIHLLQRSLCHDSLPFFCKIGTQITNQVSRMAPRKSERSQKNKKKHKTISSEKWRNLFLGMDGLQKHCTGMKDLREFQQFHRMSVDVGWKPRPVHSCRVSFASELPHKHSLANSHFQNHL